MSEPKIIKISNFPKMLLKTVSGVILVPKNVLSTQKIIWSHFGAHMARSIFDHFRAFMGFHKEKPIKPDFDQNLEKSKITILSWP